MVACWGFSRRNRFALGSQDQPQHAHDVKKDHVGRAVVHVGWVPVGVVVAEVQRPSVIEHRAQVSNGFVVKVFGKVFEHWSEGTRLGE